jgi:hypothetical protein
MGHRKIRSTHKKNDNQMQEHTYGKAGGLVGQVKKPNEYFRGECSR